MDNLGFKDNDDSTIDYSYDLNGNLVKDLNKGITSIEYNYLNLPRQVKKDQNNKVVYTYDATGAKLRMTATVNGVSTHRYYAGGFEYDGVNLHLIQFDEGVTNVTEPGGVRNYVPEYHIKDHLGNIRVAFIPNGTSVSLTQINDYYAFGKISWSISFGDSDNKYLYNGKELQDELDLDWYDYGARFYDPVIARFTTQDPMTESHTDYTPYHYTFNNPLRFIDPIGLDTVQVNSETPIQAGDQVELANCTVTEPTPFNEQQLAEVTVTPEETETQTENSKPNEAGSDAVGVLTGGMIFKELIKRVPSAIKAFITSAIAGNPLVEAGSVIFIPGDTPIDHDPMQFAQHGKNRGTLDPEELEVLRAKKAAGTLSGVEKQKLKRHEKNTGERASRQSKDKKR